MILGRRCPASERTFGGAVSRMVTVYSRHTVNRSNSVVVTSQAQRGGAGNGTIQTLSRAPEVEAE